MHVRPDHRAGLLRKARPAEQVPGEIAEMCRIPGVSCRAALRIRSEPRVVKSYTEKPLANVGRQGKTAKLELQKFERLPMKKLLAALFATAMLGGCAVYTDGPGHGGGGGYGKQCPPGQAKKGNC